jgi:predicted transcriptional regulator
MSKEVEARLGDLQLKVYDVIRLAGWDGRTCDEVEVETKLTHQCCSARINELVAMKLVERRGAMRATRTGRKAFIYVQAGLTGAEKRQQP